MLPITSLNDNQYSGNGTWTDSEGNTGQYFIKTNFKNNVMTSQYDAYEGRIDVSFTFVFTGGGNFNLYNYGGLVASGFCENALPLTCTYSYDVGGGTVYERLQFLSGTGNLVKTGQKTYGDYTATWEETLKLISNN